MGLVSGRYSRLWGSLCIHVCVYSIRLYGVVHNDIMYCMLLYAACAVQWVQVALLSTDIGMEF